MEIDIQPIQIDLQEAAGNCKMKVKLDKKQSIADHLIQTDKGFLLKLNPLKFGNDKKLQEHISRRREEVSRY